MINGLCITVLNAFSANIVTTLVVTVLLCAIFNWRAGARQRSRHNGRFFLRESRTMERAEQDFRMFLCKNGATLAGPDLRGSAGGLMGSYHY